MAHHLLENTDPTTITNPGAGQTKYGFDVIGRLWKRDSAGVITYLEGGSSSKWTALVLTTDYATVPASTSTITMNTDQTANIKAGMALKYTIGGVDYYGVATTVAANLLTIAGAALGGNITALYYSPLPGMVEMVAFIVSGTFADAASTTLLADDVLTKVKWDKPNAYCVKQEVTVTTDDSGANQPRVNVTLAGSAVNTSNTNAGLTVAETWVNSVVDINTTNYSIIYGEAIEVTTDANGSNLDASDLTIQLTFVYA
jgi:hypothetical protein